MQKNKKQTGKLFVGMISENLELFEKVKKVLEKIYGKIDCESEIFPWEHTDYYKEELGENLKRKFISFKKIIPCEKIKEIKLKTIEIEKNFSEKGSRKINIDPGYITLSKIVLASTKDYSHRIYLGKGIFAEVTLYFKKGSFCAFEYTYPDYRTQGYINFFNKIRESLKKREL